MIQSGKLFNLSCDDNLNHEEIDSRTGFKTKSILVIPIRDNQDQVIGVIEMINKKDGKFTKQDEHRIQILSNHAGIYVNNIQALTEIQTRRKKVDQLLIDVSSQVNLLKSFYQNFHNLL